MTMEEFSNTFEALEEYTNIGLPLLPAFQTIQQFKSLPDFLIYPTFLALRHQDCSTSASPQVLLLRDMQITHAMKTFVDFAQEARERSQSTSDALNYACQNWAFHLSQAPSPWDDRLKHMFVFFGNRNLLSWLERQWCLKGLRSCLIVLSEGQKLAKVCVFLMIFAA
ncbi:hypothetical protein DFH29DRAFT_464563 [Suillus ampliporus]|nr:hypothetical protein DFH29DRAFT_464563 [Suillus ampliporus]